MVIETFSLICAFIAFLASLACVFYASVTRWYLLHHGLPVAKPWYVRLYDAVER